MCMGLVLIFIKFGMYLIYQNRSLGPLFMVLSFFFTFHLEPFRVQNDFRELVFKGLIQINILGVLDAFQFNAL